jgi:hypothetical protein
MALNLHNIVRPAIDALNPSFTGVWRQSTGYTTASDGTRTPTYTNATVPMRVQALSGRDLKHTEFLNMQGVKRSVYLYGDVQGVVRPDVKGGDILQFPETRGGTNRDWLVVVVLETWSPDASGWCKVGVVLQ